MKVIDPKRLLSALAVVLFAVSGHAQTHTVVVRAVPQTMPVEALIEATRQATVAAQQSGRIVEMRAEAGQSVNAGQVLARIDAREAAENVAATRAQLVQAEAHFQRTQGLFKRKFVSQAALDAAETQLTAARAHAAAAVAGASHATLSAPLSGIIAQRHAELGDLAMPGKPLVTLFDPRGMRAVASVSQFRLADAQKATAAKVEFPESGRWLDGVSIEILPTIDPRSHTATARILLPAAAGLVPGMAARVHFVVGQTRKLTVPPQAILRRGEISAVYVLRDGQSSLRQVRLGEPVADGEIEVLAGLASGETISLDPVRTGIERRQK